MDASQLAAEISRRRTFAIISHPDAGKTTLTEKLLLYGGAIHVAGAVSARSGRQTTSDWMAIEKQRGISVSTSVLQFDYEGRRVNLLDTPGHNDFSEDTFRTLAAADTAVMLIDSVKGVEPQTIKLFNVCRLRNIPIVTFINKLDRPGRDPLDLLDEIERILGIPCCPVNWPVGNGQDFRGVYDRWSHTLFCFERNVGGARRVETISGKLGDPALVEHIGQKAHDRLVEEISLLDGATSALDNEKIWSGQLTPVFFGSAATNFGVGPFLDAFVEIAPPPRPRNTSSGIMTAEDPRFSAFVFKIQANMDPRHRDRIAFARVCSGKFTRGMDVLHARTGKEITLARSLNFLAHERVQVDEAYSGDIIGLWDPGVVRIGDTLCGIGGPGFEFEGIPRFSPEHFVRVRSTDAGKRKQLKKGLDQLSEEGAVQLFFDRKRLERDPVLGAVGQLQFEVTQYRLQAEYNAPVAFDRLPYHHARWIEGATEAELDKFERGTSSTCIVDVEGRPLVLFESPWLLARAEQDNPKLKFIAAVQPGRSVRAA